jgi:thiol:disulfide interchange protein DsbD
MYKIRILALFLISYFILICSTFSQPITDADVLNVNSKLSVDKVQPGSIFNIAFIININPQFHINSNTPSDEFLRPTVLKFEPLANVSFGRIIYPKPAMIKFPFSDTPLSVYEDEIVIFSEVQLAENYPIGLTTIKYGLEYQACNDFTCLAPTIKEIEIPIEVVEKSEIVTSINQDIFKKLKVTTTNDISFTTDEQRAKEIIEKGLPYAIIVFFVFGLALNLTPCVYPVIPITISYFGGQSDRRRGSSFVIALFYVIGIAIVFSILGLISGLAGKQWGFLFQNPWFVIAITVVILTMAASMFGAFEITIPSWLTSSLGKSREGVLGAFIMGLTVGIVIAPCAAGIIIGLVGLVAKLGIVVKGTLLFFIMGLGLGLPYLILATFSGLINKIPQSGMWMVWVRKLFGILLVGVALYFFLPQAKHIYDQQNFFFGLLGIFGGLLLGFLDHAPGYTKTFKIGRGIFGVLLILFGIYLTNAAIYAEESTTGIGTPTQSEETAIPSKESTIYWVMYTNESIDDFIQRGKPVILDFYADWCAPCKQMDNKTFKQKEVIEQSKHFTMIKIDCTAPNNDIRKFMDKYELKGMPTYIFISNEGEEIKELREIGFVEYTKFLENMEKLSESGS